MAGPRVPDIPDFAKLNFVTGYVLQMCQPPFWALVEFAKEPTKDLMLILLGLDTKDIVTGWLRPERQRRRNAGRHGRKRPRLSFGMDPNEYLGGNARAKYKGWPGLDLPGARALFMLDGVLERIAITAAVVEGVTNIGYESLLGVLTMHPEHCPGMNFVTRHHDTTQQITGATAANRSLFLNTLDASQGFNSTNQGLFNHSTMPWYLGGSARIEMTSAGSAPIGLTVWSQDRGELAVSPRQTLAQGQAGYFSVGADIEPGEWAWLGRWNEEGGSVQVSQAAALGFAGGLW